MCQVLGGLLLGETQRQTRLRDCPRLSLSLEWAMGVLFKSWSISLLCDGPERFNPRQWPHTLMLATKAALRYQQRHNDNKIHYKTALKKVNYQSKTLQLCFHYHASVLKSQPLGPPHRTRPENCSAGSEWGFRFAVNHAAPGDGGAHHAALPLLCSTLVSGRQMPGGVWMVEDAGFESDAAGDCCSALMPRS